MSIFKFNRNRTVNKVDNSVTSSGTITAVTGANLTTTPGNGYRYYTYNTAGARTVTATVGGPYSVTYAPTHNRVISSNQTSRINFFMIGGGGGGGLGGGGAGGVVISTVGASHGSSNSSLPIVVGAGGTGWIYYLNPATNPISGAGNTTYTQDGGNSSIGNIIAYGGGGGGGGQIPTQPNIRPGGCGGGCYAGGWSRIPGGTGIQTTTANPGIANLIQYGTPGGNGAFYNGGGGGGIGTAGQDAQATGFTDGSNRPSFGGGGLQLPDWTGPIIGMSGLAPYSGFYGGGGGGGSGRDGWVNNAGAAPKPNYMPGGGGKAADHNGSTTLNDAVAGIDNLGAGGGGYSWFPPSADPGMRAQPGGTGIVVIRTPA